MTDELFPEPSPDNDIEVLNLVFLEDIDLHKFLDAAKYIYNESLNPGQKVKIGMEVMITATQYTYYVWKEEDGQLKDHLILEPPASSQLKIDDSSRPF